MTKSISKRLDSYKFAKQSVLSHIKERANNNLVILGQPFFHQTTLFFCEQWGYLKEIAAV